MLTILRGIFDWIEVWALLIPLTVFLIYKPKSSWITPLLWYLVIGLALNLCIDFIWYVNKEEWFGVSMAKKNTWNNNIYYQLHSIARLLLFSWFFATQGKGFRRISRVIPSIFLIAALVFLTVLRKVSFNYLMALEAGLLLIYCLWFTYKIIRDDVLSFSSTHPPLWVVGGLTLFTAVNFFIYLFYNYLIQHSRNYAVSIWDIHNFLFLILCVCISISFYNEPNRK